MKKGTAILLSVISALSLGGCKKSLDYVIDNEPSIRGSVKETYEGSILIENETGEYFVSLDVEYSDSMTDFSVGDEVAVYYDGLIAESYPMQINNVYAIMLLEPADRSENNKS